jgi:uncharacterized protein with GYD domain
MKRIFTLAMMVAFCALLSSCSPRPISGQVSVVTQAGANFFLGGVQVAVISAQDADDYMQQCQAQIDGKARALKEAYNVAKKNYDVATRAESETPTAATKAELELARTKLTIAAHALKNFPTANDYFAGFMPVTIETTVTDAEGAFTIDRPKQAAKVFAKAQKQTSNSVENYYWLVDLPATGDKLVLNNDNMFTVPRQSAP